MRVNKQNFTDRPCPGEVTLCRQGLYNRLESFSRNCLGSAQGIEAGEDESQIAQSYHPLPEKLLIIGRSDKGRQFIRD
jgi:hypothetical protein